jgi:predicted nucleic-acid-binding Zn-ribbon protein
MIHKQCVWCAKCKKNYPEDIALTIYPVTLSACPRCTETEFTEIETSATPEYQGAPAAVKKTRTLF